MKFYIVQKDWDYIIINNITIYKAFHINTKVTEFNKTIYKIKKV